VNFIGIRGSLCPSTALDTARRKAPVRYVLRPPVAQERVQSQKDGLVAIAIKRAYADGTAAVVRARLSLLCRLAMSLPPPRYHTVKYAGVVAPASKWRAQIARVQPPPDPTAETLDAIDEAKPPAASAPIAPADLLKRTFHFDVLR
jgi:hypothetical protein